MFGPEYVSPGVPGRGSFKDRLGQEPGLSHVQTHLAAGIVAAAEGGR